MTTVAKDTCVSPARRLGRPPATRAEDTRRRILDVARRIYADLGYEISTNKMIADEAGVTPSALYYYYPSKRDLYLAVHDDARDHVYARFNEVLDPGTSFADQVLAVLEATHQLNEEDPTLARFLGAARVDMRRRVELFEAFEQRTKHRNEFFDRIVDVGVRTGEITTVDRPVVRAFIVAVLIGMTDGLSDDQQLHRDAIDAVRAILENNLVRPLERSVL